MRNQLECCSLDVGCAKPMQVGCALDVSVAQRQLSCTTSCVMPTHSHNSCDQRHWTPPNDESNKFMRPRICALQLQYVSLLDFVFSSSIHRWFIVLDQAAESALARLSNGRPQVGLLPNRGPDACNLERMLVDYIGAFACLIQIARNSNYE